MQREIKLNKESTIYHYQLIRKLRIRTEMLVSYAVIALLFAAFQYIFYNNDGLLTWILGLVMIIVIHWAILRLTMLRVDEPEDRRWGWRFKLPWSGYLPVQWLSINYSVSCIVICYGLDFVQSQLSTPGHPNR